MKHALILYLPVKTGTVSRMTGGAGLIDKRQQSVAVTINTQFDQLLNVSGRFSFPP